MMTSDLSYPTAKELREKFEQDLFHLQLNCKHPSSKWMAHSWAPGHYWGEVLVCDICEKILDRRTPIPTSESYNGWKDVENFDNYIHFDNDDSSPTKVKEGIENE